MLLLQRLTSASLLGAPTFPGGNSVRVCVCVPVRLCEGELLKHDVANKVHTCWRAQRDAAGETAECFSLSALLH